MLANVNVMVQLEERLGMYPNHELMYASVNVLQNWTRMSIMNTSGSHFFSSDRTIHEYAKDIWDITPSPVL
jgi:glucan phosphorylase